jgi:hypothetical protein
MFVLIEPLLERARALNQQRLELDRKSKELSKQVDSLTAEIIAQMHAAGVTEACGSRIVVKQKAFISDWTALNEYIKEHDATDLLQKRLTETAVRLRWDDGIAIPGVGMVEEEKLVL